ncbi:MULTISPECIES: hypothetical protein [Xanthomonas]|uniref:hypothetical protein n=1 Tax=Xanthomonas TaxID=338 RepID=UPI000F8CC56F|nr:MULTISPECIES: hypothetical protein [Xanthomonas]
MSALKSLIWVLLVVASPVYAGDSCTTLMCMSGKLAGVSTGQSCVEPMTDYFKIVRFDRHGYSERKTKSARQSYLDSCSSETSGEGKRINEKFGTMRLGF